MTDRKHKQSKAKEVALFLAKGLIVLILALLPGVFIIVKFDPYNFLGNQPKPYIYIQNERFQIPGMARHEDYEIAVLGTSMIENFSDSYLSEKFGAGMAGANPGGIRQVCLRLNTVSSRLFGAIERNVRPPQ